MLHGISTYIWAILGVNVGIPAPWSIWEMSKAVFEIVFAVRRSDEVIFDIFGH